MSGDVARATVFVAVPPARAFDIFTLEIDAWWRRGPAWRIAGKRPGVLKFQDGRLLEVVGDRTWETGRVTAWEPAARLEFEWRGVNFRPGESTTVEVRFKAQNEGTLVTVEHRGWSALPADHPVRHGQEVAEFIRGVGMCWGGLLTSLREHAA
jgi:uncharacterized protein YndB with AHSA1/START domain